MRMGALELVVEASRVREKHVTIRPVQHVQVGRIAACELHRSSVRLSIRCTRNNNNATTTDFANVNRNTE